VHELEAAGAAAQAGGGERKGEPPFFAPGKDELQAMAKECKLKWDFPSLGLQPQTVGPKQAAALGLSDQERSEIDRVTAEESQRTVRELRALYAEVTGDRAGADALTPHALEEEILQKSPDAMVQQAYYRLSHERAGLVPSPTDPSGEPPVERMLRLMTTLGDDYEQRLGAAIGPDRAHQLRAENNGWSSRNLSSRGCPGE
jgi:hypothetical protein